MSGWQQSANIFGGNALSKNRHIAPGARIHLTSREFDPSLRVALDGGRPNRVRVLSWQRSQPHMGMDAASPTPLATQWCLFLGPISEVQKLKSEKDTAEPGRCPGTAS